MPIFGDTNNFDEHLDRVVSASIGEEPDASTETADTSAEGGTTTTTESTSGERTPAEQNSNSNAAKPDTQPKAVKEGKKDQGSAAGPQDLTLTDGTVVKAGAERRFFEAAQIARQESANYKNQAKQATDNYTRVKSELTQLQTTVSNLHGVDPNTASLGVRIVQDMQRDPVGTVRKLLTEVISQGHSIEGIGAGVDTAAITRLIESRLAPITSQQDTVEQEQRLQQETLAEVNQFYGSYPDARLHDQHIAKVLQDYPQMNLTEAYFALKNEFNNNGFDWNRGLVEQVQERSAQQSQQPTPKAMPNGRTPANVRPTSEVAIAHENTSLDDIIKASMRESGLNI